MLLTLDSAIKQKEAVEMDKDPFSFSVLYERPMNQQQKEVMVNLLEDCAEYYEMFEKEGHAITANSKNFHDMNIHHRAVSMKHGRPSLYEHLEKKKQGITGVSSNRVVPYQEEWEAAGNTGEVPIICNVDFHHLPVPFQHKMVDEAIDLGRKYTFLPGEHCNQIEWKCRWICPISIQYPLIIL